MKERPKPSRIRSKKRSYPLEQSALYKIGSKKRLAEILCIPLHKLLFLASNENNYILFTLPEEVCPFTNKIKKERLVQEPKGELRSVHERLLKLLRHVVPPSFAHGAIKGYSYRSNAIAHKDSPRVATFDLRHFYSSTSSSRVYDFWAKQMQCAPDVAMILKNICCWNSCVPTGSPLSPLLSLYSNKHMFEELNSLAARHNLKFTCYIDDLTFSGGVIPSGLKTLVDNLVQANGHTLSAEKTKVFRRNQRKHVTGVVLFGNNIEVPNSRLQKAPAIRNAIKSETDINVKVGLTRKLAGLLGEAAHIDNKYGDWAKRTYVDLKELTFRRDEELPF